MEGKNTRPERRNKVLTTKESSYLTRSPPPIKLWLRCFCWISLFPLGHFHSQKMPQNFPFNEPEISSFNDTTSCVFPPVWTASRVLSSGSPSSLCIENNSDSSNRSSYLSCCTHRYARRRLRDRHTRRRGRHLASGDSHRHRVCAALRHFFYINISLKAFKTAMKPTQ